MDLYVSDSPALMSQCPVHHLPCETQHRRTRATVAKGNVHDPLHHEIQTVRPLHPFPPPPPLQKVRNRLR